MNYSLLIEERKSSRAFQDEPVASGVIDDVRAYHDGACARLLPDIKTELFVADKSAQSSLEKAAGYNEFLVGAPHYLVLLTEDKDGCILNAGYVMEDLSLKLNDLGCGTCWLTFTDSDAIKKALSIDSALRVAAILAFGKKKAMRKRIHLNILTMSNIGVTEKQQYYDPKKKISDLVYLDNYQNKDGVDERLGFYEDMLWEAFHAAANAPSYLNLQPYSFLMKDEQVILLSEKDDLTKEIDRDLNLGIVMLHFAAVAQSYLSNLKWDLSPLGVPALPDGVSVVASCIV